ncbi:MAG: hypothetical protein ACR2RL_08870 [Gammaproteobacteria bacterium]
MNRRQLLCAASSVVTVALVGRSHTVLADDLKVVPYSRAAFDQALENGEPFLLDFYAAW